MTAIALTILSIIGYALGGLLLLAVAASGLLFWAVTRNSPDDWQGIADDDEYLSTSARGEAHRARYPEEQRGF